MNDKNLAELRRMNVKQLTGIYLDKLFAGNPVNFSEFNGKGIAFSDGFRSVNLSDLKISDTNRDQILSRAEQDTVAYASARNRNSQPANLSGFDQNLVKSVREWVAKRNVRLRGSKKS